MRFLPSRIHTYIGLVVGVVLVIAPWILGFSDNRAARLTAIIIGLLVIVNELSSTSPSSPLKVVPMPVHLGMDVVTGGVLAASPWLFGFADEDANVWVPHLIVGLLIIGYALVTDPRDDDTTMGAVGMKNRD